MKYLFCLFTLILPCTTFLHAQHTIEISYAQDMKGNITFSCMNRAYCNYVVQVDVTTMDNLSSEHALPFTGEVKPGLNKLFTLKKVNPSADVQLRYKSANRKGCLQPAVNKDFTYLLPIAPGKSAQAYIIDSTVGYYNGIPGAGFSIRLRMHPGDTIYSARRGIVSGMEVSSSQNDAGTNGPDDWNYVEIVQGDCTFARYGILKKDGALVHPGQLVEAGTPIGIIGGDKYGRGSDLRFSVEYFHDNVHQLLPLQFWTKKNGRGELRHGATYTSEHPADLINQEKAKPKPKAPVKKGKGKSA